jgi:hypothetical protein
VKNWESANKKRNSNIFCVSDNTADQDKNQASQATICAVQGYGGEPLRGFEYAFLSSSYDKNDLYLK